MLYHLGCILLILAQVATLIDGGAIFSMQMKTFRSNGRDAENHCCDSYIICTDHCDPVFQFCFDNPAGEPYDNDDCQYGTFQTGSFENKDNIDFGSNLAGISNPMKIRVPKWLGSVRMKVTVTDRDSGAFQNDDYIDHVYDEFKASRPDLKANTARGHPRVMRGTRARGPTSLSVVYKVYCEDNYYGPFCNVSCIPHDDASGHYTCHPETGAKICMKGKYCDVSINECLSSPCKNGSTCHDNINGYKCTCMPGFAGRLCDMTICQTNSPCLNGGTCVNRDECICPRTHFGKICERDTCDRYECHNNGTCNKGLCSCPPGYVGLHCDVAICDYLKCHRGGTCVEGVCQCPDGFMGLHCELLVPPPGACISQPCQNKATCYDVRDGYICVCKKGYSGPNCEEEDLPGNSIPITEKSSASTETSNRVYDNFPMWILAVIGGFLLLLIIILIFVYVIRRQNREKSTQANFAASTDHQTMTTDTATANFSNPMYDDVNNRQQASAQTEPPLYSDIPDHPPKYDDSFYDNFKNQQQGGKLPSRPPGGSEGGAAGGQVEPVYSIPLPPKRGYDGPAADLSSQNEDECMGGAEAETLPAKLAVPDEETFVLPEKKPLP